MIDCTRIINSKNIWQSATEGKTPGRTKAGLSSLALELVTSTRAGAWIRIRIKDYFSIILGSSSIRNIIKFLFHW